MVQAAVLDGEFFYPFSPFDDGRCTPEVGIGWRDVSEAFVIALVVVVLDEGPDLSLKVAGQIVVLQQDAVFQCLMPELDLALGLGMVWCAANMIHALVATPFSQVSGDIRRSVVAEQPGLVNDIGTVTA